MTKEQALKVWHESFGFNEVECPYKLQEAISTAFKALAQESKTGLCRKALKNTLDEIYDNMCPEVITDSSGDTHGYYPENYEEYEKMFEIIKRNFKDIYPDLFKGGLYDKKGIC